MSTLPTGGTKREQERRLLDAARVEKGTRIQQHGEEHVQGCVWEEGKACPTMGKVTTTKEGKTIFRCPHFNGRYPNAANVKGCEKRLAHLANR